MDKIELTAYCVKTKQKAVPIQDAVIFGTARGGYIAIGHDGNGNKLSSLLSASKATDCIKYGIARLGNSSDAPKTNTQIQEQTENILSTPYYGKYHPRFSHKPPR